MADGRYQGGFNAEKPVKEGQIYEIEIIALGSKGDGIGKVQGFVVVVPGTKPGQKVTVKVTAVRGKVAFGEVAGESTGAEESPKEGAEVAQGAETEETQPSGGEEGQGEGDEEQGFQ